MTAEDRALVTEWRETHSVERKRLTAKAGGIDAWPKRYRQLVYSPHRAAWETGSPDWTALLALAIIALAVEDLRSPVERLRAEAKVFVYGREPDFAWWCGIGDLDPESVRHAFARP